MAAQNEFGIQADAWGALLMGRANLAPQVEEETIKNMEAKGLENLHVEKRNVALEGLGESREHVVFSQSLPRGGGATVALRVAQRGAEDLELSWRLFEQNVVTGGVQAVGQSSLVLLGVGFVIVGTILSVFGVGLIGICIGLILIGAGLGWWGKSRGKTTASAYGQFDSRVLAQNVDYALMKAFAGLGVAAQELRVLRQASMGGLGNLAGVDHLSNIPPPRL